MHSFLSQRIVGIRLCVTEGVTDGYKEGGTLGDDDGLTLKTADGTAESVEEGRLLGLNDGFNDGTPDGARDEHGSHKALQLSDTPVILHFHPISASSMLLHFCQL